MSGDLIELFPSPLAISKYPSDYTKELEWCRNHICDKESSNNRQSRDTFILDVSELSAIRSFIESKLDSYAENILGCSDKLIITQSWLNKNKQGSMHHEHFHPNSIVSGVWYPSMDGIMPYIEFKSSRQREISLKLKDLNQYNSSIFRFGPTSGDLLLFPSNLIHSVPVNKSNSERISLSFNTWIEGSMGSKELLTYVP